MSHAEFILTYDGPAMAGHEMNVRDLAPAMLAVGEAFEGMNALFNGKSAQLAVNVRAHQPGCFKVAFDIVQMAKDATPILTGPGIVAANNLLQLLIGVGTVAGASGAGLILLIRQLKGRSPERIERLTPGLFRLFIDDQTYEVPTELLQAYQDLRVRRALEGFVTKPLRKLGITHVLIEDGQRSVRVDEAEAEYFAAPEPDVDIVVDDTRRAAFTIRDLSFDEEGFWRLFDGSNPVKVRIEDVEFLRRIEGDDIRFAKHDVLVCLVHFVQRRTGRGLENEHTVIEVIEHIPAPRQLRLPEITEPREDDDDPSPSP
jgi:hypothetical protein